MPINYPASLDTLTNPQSTDGMNSPSHSGQHGTANDILEALEAKVGADSSAVTTSLDYLVKNASSSNPGHKHTQSAISDATATAAASKIPISDGSGKLDTWITDASDTAKGKVELATAAETTTGSDATKAVTPDGLAGSEFGKRIVQVKVFDDATALATGDGKAIFCVPPELNGMNLVDADAFVTTVSSSGAPNIMIRNVTDSQDMLSTAITIDASEYTSYTAATAPVINTSYDDVATGDRIAIDVDGAGTGAKGLGVTLSFQIA